VTGLQGGCEDWPYLRHVWKHGVVKTQALPNVVLEGGIYPAHVQWWVEGWMLEDPPSGRHDEQNF
jgi:hypothetical protein